MGTTRHLGLNRYKSLKLLPGLTAEPQVSSWTLQPGYFLVCTQPVVHILQRGGIEEAFNKGDSPQDIADNLMRMCRRNPDRYDESVHDAVLSMAVIHVEDSVTKQSKTEKDFEPDSYESYERHCRTD